jgi:hypothetical protein
VIEWLPNSPLDPVDLVRKRKRDKVGTEAIHDHRGDGGVECIFAGSRQGEEIGLHEPRLDAPKIGGATMRGTLDHPAGQQTGVDLNNKWGPRVMVIERPDPEACPGKSREKRHSSDRSGPDSATAANLKHRLGPVTGELLSTSVRR